MIVKEFPKMQRIDFWPWLFIFGGCMESWGFNQARIFPFMLH